MRLTRKQNEMELNPTMAKRLSNSRKLRDDRYWLDPIHHGRRPKPDRDKNKRR